MINKCHLANNHIRQFSAISPMSCNKTMIKVQLMRIVQGAHLKVYDIIILQIKEHTNLMSSRIVHNMLENLLGPI